MTSARRSPPKRLLRTLSAAQRDEVAAWWRSLDENARHELGAAPSRSGSDEPEMVLQGRPVDPQEQAENEQWTAQLREYVNGHEVPFFMEEKRFHICRAHRIAREVTETGVLPAAFSCPLEQAACPFAAALSLHPGCAVHLVPVPSGPAAGSTNL